MLVVWQDVEKNFRQILHWLYARNEIQLFQTTEFFSASECFELVRNILMAEIPVDCNFKTLFDLFVKVALITVTSYSPSYPFGLMRTGDW